MSRSGTPVETGLDVLDSSFSRQHTHLVRPILNEINAMLGDQVPKSQRYYDTAVMGVVAQELADRPRNGQLSSNLLRPKKFSQMCRAFAASMPSSYFKSGGLNIYGFFEGLLEFLRTPPAPGAENVNQAPLDSNIEGGVLRESEMAAPRASIEQDVISINSESSEDSSSESDSSQKSDDDTTAVPRRSTKGKQRAFSNPGEDEVSSPSESHPSPTPPRRTIMKKKYPVAGIDQKVFKRERTDAGTTTTNHTKKRVRDSGLDCDLPRAKRPILDTTEPADERDNSPEDPQKPDEPIPAQAAPKKRNAYKLANEDLQAQVDFFKTMFLYGAGIPETDLLAYRMRVEKMQQSHKQAWDVMTGKKNVENAARKASSGSTVGTKTNSF